VATAAAGIGSSWRGSARRPLWESARRPLEWGAVPAWPVAALAEGRPALFVATVDWGGPASPVAAVDGGGPDRPFGGEQRDFGVTGEEGGGVALPVSKRCEADEDGQG